MYSVTHLTWLEDLWHLWGGLDSRSCSLPLLCHFGQLHLTVGIVICVSDVEFLGKNIPCKSLIELLFSQVRWILLLYSRNKNYCCLYELQQSWVGKDLLVWLVLKLRMPKIFKQQKFTVIKFLHPWYSSIITLRLLQSSS